MKSLVMNTIFSISILAACGGDDGGSGDGALSCGTEPCGGDPVGVWTVQESCFDGDFTVEQCPELVVNSFDASQTGTVTVNDDMSYSLDLEVTGSASVTFPASCFGGLLTDCAQLNDDGTTCTGDAQTECDCELTLDEVIDESGTWSVSGNQITLDDGTNEPETSDFCVSGDSASVSTETEGVRAEMILTR